MKTSANLCTNDDMHRTLENTAQIQYAITLNMKSLTVAWGCLAPVPFVLVMCVTAHPLSVPGVVSFSDLFSVSSAECRCIFPLRG